MDYITLPPASAELGEAPLKEDNALITLLYEALQGVPDGRRGQGKRYELALLISLLVLAKLAGQTTLSGATEWLRHRGETIAKHFRLRRNQMPCQMTYCRMLASVDGKQLDELLAAFACSLGSEASMWRRIKPPAEAAELP